MLWLASSYLEEEATIQEGVMKFHLHIEIRDVDGTFLVMFSAVHDRLYWSCVARTY